MKLHNPKYAQIATIGFSGICSLLLALHSSTALSADGFFAKGKVDRISTGSSLLMVAIVDGTACLTSEAATRDSTAAMAAILVAARLAEGRLGTGAAVMNCGLDVTIQSVRMCAYGFQSESSTLCKDS